MIQKNLVVWFLWTLWKCLLEL